MKLFIIIALLLAIPIRAYIAKANAFDLTTCNGVSALAYTPSSGFICNNISSSLDYGYEGTNKRSPVVSYFNSGTVGSGVVAFNLTADGTSGGTGIFPNGIIQSSVQAFCNDNTVPFSYSAALSNSNKTLTLTVNKAGSSFLSLLGLNVLTAPAAANGSVCNIQVVGY